MLAQHTLFRTSPGQVFYCPRWFLIIIRIKRSAAHQFIQYFEAVLIVAQPQLRNLYFRVVRLSGMCTNTFSSVEISRLTDDFDIPKKVQPQ